MNDVGHIPAPSSDERMIIDQMVNHRADLNQHIMNERLQINLDARKAALRNQLDAVLFQSERALANERANRTLSRMFGSFTLVQKIMQSMG